MFPNIVPEHIFGETPWVLCSELDAGARPPFRSTISGPERLARRHRPLQDRRHFSWSDVGRPVGGRWARQPLIDQVAEHASADGRLLLEDAPIRLGSVAHRPIPIAERRRPMHGMRSGLIHLRLLARIARYQCNDEGNPERGSNDEHRLYPGRCRSSSASSPRLTGSCCHPANLDRANCIKLLIFAGAIASISLVSKFGAAGLQFDLGLKASVKHSARISSVNISVGRAGPDRR
jgi:hypothetical protein